MEFSLCSAIPMVSHHLCYWFAMSAALPVISQSFPWFKQRSAHVSDISMLGSSFYPVISVTDLLSSLALHCNFTSLLSLILTIFFCYSWHQVVSVIFMTEGASCQFPKLSSHTLKDITSRVSDHRVSHLIQWFNCDLFSPSLITVNILNKQSYAFLEGFGLPLKLISGWKLGAEPLLKNPPSQGTSKCPPA